MANRDERIEELLVEWESARLSGKEPTAAELCRNEADLLDAVQRRIDILRDLSWTLDPNAIVTESQDTASDPRVPISLDEFERALSERGVLTADEVAQAAHSYGKQGTAQDFADYLLEKKQISSYQAQVILERGDSPLLLDRYVILDSIGAGGMGIVFKALQRSLDRVVAVKVLPKHAINSPDHVARFQREMRAVAKLSHTNVVQAIDAHESNGIYFLAMEYVDGCDLAALVEEHGTLPVEEATNIIAQAAAGLGCAHANQIIHRDVKPGNILLSIDGTAKILDLGLARTRDMVQENSVNDLTRDGIAMGTVTYMAPEQAFDAKQADERSDIYSLGCTLYFLLHGKPPFLGDNNVQTMIAHREQAPPTLGAPDKIPPSIETLFQQMIAKSPEDRPSSMQEVAARLGTPIATPVMQLSAAPVAPPPDVPLSQAAPRGQRLPLIAATLVLLGLTLWAAFHFLSSNNERSIATQLLADDRISLAVRTEGFDAEIDFVDEIPVGSFQITGATLYPTGDKDLSAIARLTNIESLVISFDPSIGISAIDFHDLDRYGNLKQLTLDNFELEEYHLQQIAKLSKLKELTLSGCEFAATPNLELLAVCKQLETLTVTDSKITTTDLAWLQGHATISWLDISNTDITDDCLPLVSSMANLQHLFLTGTQLNNFGALASISDLVTLHVDATSFQDEHVAALLKLSQLQELDVSQTKLTSNGIENICQIASLSVLALQGLEIDNSITAIAAIRDLIVLDVAHTDLTDAGLSKLHRSKDLQQLDVEGTSVSDNAINRFQRKAPNCDIYSATEFIEGI